MTSLAAQLWQALLMAAGMAWQVGWSLVLGFVISGILQAVVPAAAVARALGRAGLRQVVVATLAGAASSSCSYAAAAVSRTLFKKGAALTPALAYLFASTNLVVELGLVLYLLMGWQFTAGEWIGGVVLVAIMSGLVAITYPAKLIEAGRQHAEPGSPARQADAAPDSTPWTRKLLLRQTWVQVAHNVVMDARMLWKDLLIGFLIAGVVAVFIPAGWWQVLFVHDAPAWLRIPANALIGPLVAMLTFVCSIGNVPLAAVLWGAGVSFGGVLAFLYADLIVLPLIDVYRRYYGGRMALYIAGIFYATMVLASIVMELAFHALGWVPRHHAPIQARMEQFSLNYTFWLNLGFGALAIALYVLHRRNPARTAHHCEHHAHG